jgi:cytochrome c oxidase cbb3-type subunit 1
MSTASETAQTPAQEWAARARIDASTRLPVLFFFATAFAWLMAATILGFIASTKLHNPEFFGGCAWLTYGRVSPAYLCALVYGWAIPAGTGTALWIMARLCGISLSRPVTPLLAGLVWHAGVALGVLEILAGNRTGFELLEFPRYVGAILFVSYAFLAAWGLVMFRRGDSARDSVPAWYLCAGLLGFPWALGTASVMLSGSRLQGVMQPLANGWYVQSLLGLWFVSIGLGTLYYLIAKVTGRPIYSRTLASVGFWSYLLFCGWTGVTRLTGGPLPVWLVTAGIVAAILMLIPVAAVTCNYTKTMRDNYHRVYYSPTIRFALFGGVAWTVSSLAAVLLSLRSVERLTHFTQIAVGQTHCIVYAFYTMVMFGAMYYIIPRLLGREWVSASFIRMHFWGAAYGCGMMCLLLFIGGLAQGSAWADSSLSAVQVGEMVSPYYRGRSIAWLLLIGAHLAFGLHLALMLLRFGKYGGRPTLFAEEETKS